MSSSTSHESTRNPQRSDRHPRRRRQLNVRLLIVSLTLLAVLIPAVYFWHSLQVGRVAIALSAEADRCIADGEPKKATGYLYRLLQMDLEDSQRAETLIRLAQSYDQAVTRRQEKPTVIQWYYRAIGAAPDRVDLQLRLTELFLETQQFRLAEKQADEILNRNPTETHASKLRALRAYSQLRQGEPLVTEEVLQELQQVQRNEPSDLAVAQALARLYRESPGAVSNLAAQRADEVMDELVQGASEDFEAHLARFQYRMQYQPEEASADLRQALRLAPEEPDVLLAAAEWAVQQDATDEAVGFYRRLVETHPDDARAYLGWGDCLFRLGDVERAVETWQRGKESARSGQLLLQLRLVGALINLQRLDEAEQELASVSTALSQRIANKNMAETDALISSRDLLAARLAIARRQDDRAIELLQRVATTAKRRSGVRVEDSVPFQARLEWGQLELRREAWENAVDCFRKALEIAPQSAAARLGAAQALFALGRDREALTMCQLAIEQSCTARQSVADSGPIADGSPTATRSDRS